MESALKTAHVDLYVGSDHIVRKISGELQIEPPSGSSSGPKKVDLTFDLSLSDVNQPQTINAPSGAKPLNELFQQLGVNPIELLGAASGKGGSSGLGSLLNGLSGAAGGGLLLAPPPPPRPPAPPRPAAPRPPGASAQQAYLQCLKGATTPVDLQKCAALLK